MRTYGRRIAVTVVALAALLMSTVSVVAAPHVQGPVAPVREATQGMERILVKFRSESKLGPKRARIHAEMGAAVVREVLGLGVQVVEVPAGQMSTALARYRASPAVEYVEPDHVASGDYVPNDSYYAPRQYGPQAIHADEAWDITTGDTSVVVAVLDSGADFSHPDLQGKLIAGWDYVNNDDDPSDDHGHGTHVAGIIGASTDNAEGIAGVGFDTGLMVIKVLDQNNIGYYSGIVGGIVYAADHGAKVINMSLAGSSWSMSLWEAVEYAWSKGCLMVAAAGNDNTSTAYYPAAYDHVMGVSATDPNDARWSLSNFGDYVSVSAPGEGVYSTDWLGGAGPYAARSGTSQAAPHVAGVAALLLSQNSALSNTELWSTIESTADDLGDPGWDPYFGHGRVNAFQALGGSSAPTPTPTEPPTPRPTPTPNPTPTPTQEPTPAPTPTQEPTPAAIHVGDLDGASYWQSKKKWGATVTVAVHNANHIPVAHAVVSGSWSGGATGTSSCTTNSSGRCQVASPLMASKKASVTFTVAGMSAEAYGYVPTSNHDPDGDCAGTLIKVLKP